MILIKFPTITRAVCTLVLCFGISACQSTTSSNLHQQTLETLQASEKTIVDKLDRIESTSLDNDRKLQSLKEELNTLESSIADKLAQVESYIKSQNAGHEKQQEFRTVVTKSGDYVLGAIERVTIEAISQSFDARIDTGAATSSINAMDIEVFERNGDDWVRFHVIDDKQVPTDENWIEVPIVRFVNIRQASSETLERRVVVKLWTKLGELRDHSEFTLADRSQMSHPVLLGREFICDIAVVDVSREFVQSEAINK